MIDGHDGLGHDLSYQLNNVIFFRLFQIENAVQKKAVSELGVSGVQWAVIGALSRSSNNAGIPSGKLADYLVVSRQNLNGVLSRLERDGYVERRSVPEDRRTRVVRLTEQGRQFWESMRFAIPEWYKQAASRFTLDERIALTNSLNKLFEDVMAVKLPDDLRVGSSLAASED